MSDLEKSLYEAMIFATKECKKSRYNPTLMVQMIHDSGPLGACQGLLAATKTSDGFTRPWELKHLDLTVDSITLQPQFSELFPEDERATARRRLEQHESAPSPENAVQ
jgi:hypothetical protein